MTGKLIYISTFKEKHEHFLICKHFKDKVSRMKLFMKFVKN